MRKSAPRSAKPSPGGPSAFKSKIVIVAAEDCLSVPARDAGLVRMLGSVALKSGAKMESFYATPSSIKPTASVEGAEDSLSIKQMLEAMHPGNDITSKEFASAWTGVPVFVIVEHCDGRDPEFFGTPCAPMNLKAAFEANNESTNFTFTFEQFKSTRFYPGDYSGDLSFSEPNEVTGFAVAFAKANLSQQYILDSDALGSSITIDSTDLDHGQQVVLVGGGGVDPATLANGTTGTEQFKLANGTTWTALKDATITFQVFKDGTNTYYIEQSRS